ncbi:hypothetical protein [Tenacibaculum sp. IB213877]|uniref:hypothetical protein n=1 Tax=Tenacibaculum sp. IB213877 TaxID=3097351 RepID=UPI002A5A6D8D|nr:hypothetical protein [Tenacibaculum sp. IB213877]MDY0779417.1 hypothetical protein [Tenacibaculum sp. IB213877]
MRKEKREKRKDLSVRVNLRSISKFVSRTFILSILIASCTNQPKGSAERFKYGTFEIPAGDGYGKTIIVRKDSLQIEEFTKNVSISNDSATFVKEEKHIDTLFIKWKNNFAYTLRMKSPKTKLDKDPIFVQITKVTDSSYDFTAKIGYSNFKQKGTVYIKE